MDDFTNHQLRLLESERNRAIFERVAELAENQRQIMETQRKQLACMIACSAVLRCLLRSHLAPAKLLEALLDEMDRISDLDDGVAALVSEAFTGYVSELSAATQTKGGVEPP